MKYYNYILFLSAILVISCGQKSSESVDESAANNIVILTHQQFNSNQFELGKMIKQNFEHSIKTTGMIDVPPQNRAIVSAALGGFVKHTHLIVGEQVKKGQKMVTLENQEFVILQREYLNIYNQLGFLEAEFNRNKTLFEENITSEKNFLQAKSKFEMAKSSYSALKKQLQLLNISPKLVESGSISSESTIYAPITGHVTKVNINKGSFVSPSTVIFEIVDNNHIHLELTVYEKDVLKIKKGQKIQFQIPETGDKIYFGNVHLVGTSVDKTNRSVEVHGHLDDDSQFLTGMFVEAEIIYGSQTSIALPQEALVEKDGAYHALILESKSSENYQFAEVTVEPGPTKNGYTLIKNHNDFKMDNEFLVKGVFDLIAN